MSSTDTERFPHAEQWRISCAAVTGYLAWWVRRSKTDWPHDRELDVPTLLPAQPEGDGQGDVAALLRSVADSIESLGDVSVQDVVLHTEVTGEGPRHGVAVYCTSNSEWRETGSTGRE